MLAGFVAVPFFGGLAAAAFVLAMHCFPGGYNPLMRMLSALGRTEVRLVEWPWSHYLFVAGIVLHRACRSVRRSPRGTFAVGRCAEHRRPRVDCARAGGCQHASPQRRVLACGARRRRYALRVAQGGTDAAHPPRMDGRARSADCREGRTRSTDGRFCGTRHGRRTGASRRRSGGKCATGWTGRGSIPAATGREAWDAAIRGLSRLAWRRCFSPPPRARAPIPRRRSGLKGRSTRNISGARAGFSGST